MGDDEMTINCPNCRAAIRSSSDDHFRLQHFGNSEKQKDHEFWQLLDSWSFCNLDCLFIFLYEGKPKGREKT